MYPLAVYRPSSIKHPKREGTWGVVIHWTSGHESGDVTVLRGPSVDVQFYVTKAGRVYQFVESDSQAWHAFHTANHNMVGIETEGSGEAWTGSQLAAVAKLSAWLVRLYGIPVVHVDPLHSYPDGSSPAPKDWHGFCGHADLAGIDGNDHSDTVPRATGWDAFLVAIRKELGSGFSPPWDAYAAGKLVGSGSLLNPLFVRAVSRSLAAAGHPQGPHEARLSDGTFVARGYFWRPLPGAFTRDVSAWLRQGEPVVIDGAVTLKPKG
jgi:hypothetical protein